MIMTEYVVIKEFSDLKDNGYYYAAGSAYPRRGYNPESTRIEELAGENNRQKTPLIKPQETEKNKSKK